MKTHAGFKLCDYISLQASYDLGGGGGGGGGGGLLFLGVHFFNEYSSNRMVIRGLNGNQYFGMY